MIARPSADVSPLFTTSDIAKQFRVTEMTVRRWAAAGRLPMLRVGHRLLFHRDEVARLLTPGGGRQR